MNKIARKKQLEILVTDTLFIKAKHERMLEKAGYRVKRLVNPCATEEELCEAMKNKVGYILGGVEKVTMPVIDSANKLKAIVFAGIDYKSFIPAADYASRKGILIGNTPGGPAHAVAEWAVSVALMMNRGLLENGRVGKTGCMSVPGLENQHIGIIGFGRVGREIKQLLKPFRTAKINTCSRGNSNTHLKNVLNSSDILFLCISESNNEKWFNFTKLKQMKKNALLVSVTHPGLIDQDDLYDSLKDDRIRAVIDYKCDERYDHLPLSRWYCSNKPSAFCTQSENDLVSTMAVRKLLSLIGSHRSLVENRNQTTF